MLVVNVASKCGLTPQYEALESLYEQRRDDGFAVIGFPANDFMGQEPGSNEEIAEFCQTTFDVQFPLAGKISVVGDDQHPLYKELTAAIPHAEGEPEAFRDRLQGFGIKTTSDPDILWNFEKFLVAKDGTVVRRFAPSMTPDDPAISAAIDEQLGALTGASAVTHDHASNSELSDVELRVRALESVLTEKGYVDRAALDELVETYERRIGPRNGARVVARAWVDPDYRAWLLTDATEAVASLGYAGRQGEHLQAVENTPTVHNVVVCTLCSCYPWPVLGLPPVWYKSPAYRSRAVADPRAVLRDFGVELAPDVTIRVWDSTAELRYLVIPIRPAGTDGLSEDGLAELVTRDSMIGTGLVASQ